MAERLQVGDVSFAFEDTGGGGAAVLFVHGLGGSLYGWRAQMRALSAAGYRAIAYDQRGAGLTRAAGGGLPGGPYSVEGWAADAVALLDALGVERTALVGHSMGCMVAQHAALALRERCSAVALLGGRARWPEAAEQGFEERARLARAGRLHEVAEAVAQGGLTERCREERPELWGLMVASIAANDPEGYARSALAAKEGEMRDLDRVEAPLLAFAGSEDVVTPPTEADAIAAAAPRGRSAVIEDAAHWCMLEAPGAVSDALIGFLAPSAT